MAPSASAVRVRDYTPWDGSFTLTADNRAVDVAENIVVEVSVAQFSLKRVRLNRSNFIKALTEKLFWGEDVRNVR